MCALAVLGLNRIEICLAEIALADKHNPKGLDACVMSLFECHFANNLQKIKETTKYLAKKSGNCKLYVKAGFTA